jgi:hypothetical protein
MGGKTGKAVVISGGILYNIYSVFKNTRQIEARGVKKLTHKKGKMA